MTLEVGLSKAQLRLLEVGTAAEEQVKEEKTKQRRLHATLGSARPEQQQMLHISGRQRDHIHTSEQ